MELSKPKKALRGLFTKTESDQESTETLKLEIKNDTVLDTPKISSKENETKFDANDLSLSINNIQNSFVNLKSERLKWGQEEYINLLNRIDKAQTEAFFLKGKLVGEIKDRFYEGNKLGWKNFCEETLNMNYTTANQYIRVAKEFENYSNKRSDFGFEHFKALLPLPETERLKIMESLPSSKSISVKSLRNLVAKTAVDQNLVPNTISNQAEHSVKHLIQQLLKVKENIELIDSKFLIESDKWALIGACHSLGELMIKKADLISSESELNSKRYSESTNKPKEVNESYVTE